jgi:hypothetical protein
VRVCEGVIRPSDADDYNEMDLSLGGFFTDWCGDYGLLGLSPR